MIDEETHKMRDRALVFWESCSRHENVERITTEGEDIVLRTTKSVPMI